MKRLTLVLVLLLALPGWGATYYVIKDPLLENRIRYLANTWPAADGSDGTRTWMAVLFGSVASGDSVIISGGVAGGSVTYDGELSEYGDGIPDTGQTNQIIRGAISTDPDAANHTGTVIFSGTGRSQHNLGAYHSGFDISYITFTNIPSNKAGISTNQTGTIHHCTFAESGQYPIWATTTRGLEIHHCLIKTQGITYFDALGATADLKFWCNIIRPGDDGAGGDTSYFSGARIVLEDQTAGTASIYNNLILGSAAQAISVAGTTTGGTVNIQNNVILGGWSTTAAGTVLLDSDQTGTFTNNLVLPVAGIPQSAFLSLGGVGDDGANVYTDAPRFVAANRIGYITFSSDDYNPMAGGANYTDYKAPLAAKIKAIGGKLTIYLNNTQTVDQGDWTSTIKPNLQEHISLGHVVGFHGRNHVYFTTTDVFKVTTTGSPTSPTVNVNRTTHKIELRSTEENVDIPAGANFEVTSTATIITQINATTYFRAALVVDSVYEDCPYGLGEILQDIAGAQAIGAGYIVVADRSTGSWDGGSYAPPTTGFFKSELYDGISVFETAYGSQIFTSFAYPGAVLDATARTAVRVFDSSRLLQARTGNIDSTSPGMLSNQDLYAAAACLADDISADTTSGDETADIKANINAICAYCAINGAWVELMSHKESEVSLAEWDTVLAEIVKWNGLVDYTQSSADVATLLRSSPYTYTASIGIATRTWTDASDYRLRAGSPCISAGTDLGDSYDEDYAGLDQDDWGTGWEIGAYAFRGYVLIGTSP